MQLDKFEEHDREPYSEMSQTNPLKWMNLKPVGKDKFECVSCWWQCKDFMNDALTAKYLKKSFSIYGFRCDPSVFFTENQKHMYFLLKEVLPGFMENINSVNAFLTSIKFPRVIVKCIDDFVFVELPSKYLENTLFISTITLFIRLANTIEKYSSLEEMIQDPLNRGDKSNFQACLQKPMNKLPAKYKDVVWSYGNSYECRKDGTSPHFMTSTMHNCGVVNWSW